MMKKIFSFFAVAALMGMMVACGGNDKEAKSGKDNKGETKGAENGKVENGSVNNMDATHQAAQITIHALEVMKQEPSVEAFREVMEVQMQMEEFEKANPNINEEELMKVLGDIDPKFTDLNFFQEEMNNAVMKWRDWAMTHQEEAQQIAMELSKKK